MATCAEVVDQELPHDAGEDSVSLLPLLAGGGKPVRETAVSQSMGGMLTIRKGSWKMIFGRGSGGWAKGAGEQPAQLYDLAGDLREAKNLYARKPALVAELTALMKETVENGRSTPGPKQRNDVSVRWQKYLDAGKGKKEKTQGAKKSERETDLQDKLPHSRSR